MTPSTARPRLARRAVKTRDRGFVLTSEAIAILAVSMLLPIAVLMLRQLNEVQTESVIGYGGVDRRSSPVLAAAFEAALPILECASPVTGYQDKCFRLANTTGLALIAAPPGGPSSDSVSACWMSSLPPGWNPNTGGGTSGGTTLRCLAVSPHTDRILPKPAYNAAGAPVGVDSGGGGTLDLLTWVLGATPANAGGKPFVPAATRWQREPEQDVTLFRDAEWMCIRWLPAAESGQPRWAGACPCPDDPYERYPLPWSLATIAEYGVKSPSDSSTTPPPRLPLDWAAADQFDTARRKAAPTSDLPAGCDTVPAAGCEVRALPQTVAAWNLKSAEKPARPPLWMDPAAVPPSPAAAASVSCECDMWLNPAASISGGSVCPALQGADSPLQIARSLLRPPPVAPAANPSTPVVVQGRVKMLEITVCGPSSLEQRQQGAPHCSAIHRFRLAV